MDDTISQLELEYCPPLDSALLQAILSDFDLSNEDALKEARNVLDSIKTSAAEEEAAADFNAAGTVEVSQSSPSIEDWSEAADTEMSSLSNGLSKVLLNESDASGASSPVDGPDLNSLDLHTKMLLLQELFPTINSYTVSHTLGKCDADWQRALDELLNISAFTSEGGSDGEKFAIKGIDAFAENNVAKRGRRKKRKGANSNHLFELRRAQSAASSDSTAIPTVNKWQTAGSDIDFIAKHAKLSPALVRSTYYANNASVPKTISRLLDDMLQSTSKVTTNSTSIKNHAVELGRDFPTIASSHLTALIQLTHPSTASAHELAKALVAKPLPTSYGPIVPQYTPLSLSDDEGMLSSNQSSLLQQPSLDRNTASDLAFSHREAHRKLSAQAQAAYRRSKSQRLMGGAAAYYSSVSREHAASAAAYTSSAADALVASQSTSSQLDLHGVIVNDATRIANREVNAWWNRLGESKVNGRVGVGARQAGFRIVVGVGHHSDGGKSKIGPAVYNTLVSNGWRVEKGHGVLIVQGKVRK